MEWLFSWDSWGVFFQKHGLWLMFLSAFLSATVLPGNSEVVFMGLATPILLVEPSYVATPILTLLGVAVVGNSLGSISTYWLGRLFPAPLEKDRKTYWVVQKMQRFGSPVLLLSWLPVVGDIACAVAGWLRINSFWASIFIIIGKTVRYVFLLFLLSPVISTRDFLS
ncbi:YqaA family protein [Conservatibacter flavescens]|uniref:DedA family protein n=1 Tax=Conservatibacter flavescens TaxID=28161 RepID=A0A2M8S1G4_9PAST|nr:YqaA family protein [Conservatibacter flavescens]PJG85002.1 hypothetical protein CVP05_09090 [Conservatibacter flavescens]